MEREADGKLKRFDDFSVLVGEIQKNGGERVLVVVPQETVANLRKENDSAEIEMLAENGDSAIILVKPK